MDTANIPTPDYSLSGEANDLVTEPAVRFTERITVRGKFLFAGEDKFWIKGVTYGTFRPQKDGTQFPEREVVKRDFAMMAAQGINSVRTYVPPPTWLLDLAQQTGMRVMAGLAWEQHVAFLNDRELIKTIEGRMREGVQACAGHPAILCFTIGNEIPPSIVRWHGRKRIERFLKRLYGIAKEQDPDALVTYVNFPTTEYLQLPFLDFQCFNVYLESREILANYLARLQNLAGEQPLVMAEIGLDSRRNGEDAQGESLDWQVRTAFAEGCAGAFIFAWTDEWYRGGHDIEDWDFGLTTRNRDMKPALAVVSKAFAEAPFPADTEWPAISVVVCSYNGEPTIRDTMEGLQALDYPNYEVIVVNDGSTDGMADIVAEYDVRLISTENRGLSNARNTGWQEAKGEIIAYIDDDAYPDPHWLQYLAHTFMTSDYVGAGGPNIAPPGDGPIADCVANAPGRPVHVLLSDRTAEHIPGCNMAFRRTALEAIDGFDPRYRAAGDDVDVCWRLQENGGVIGFHAAALDWHHCRNSVRTYWKQQQGYGKAEALLEGKWPEKYNAAGHFSWAGRLYGKGITEAIPFGRWRIYQGQWGNALFQSIYEPSTGMLASLPLMPEWFFLIGLLGLLSLLGLAWPPLLWAIPPLLAAIAAPIIQAILSAMNAEFPTIWPGRWQRFKLRSLTTLLHLMQPVARLKGRIRHGLTPWRKRGQGCSPRWRPYSSSVWREKWQEPEAMLHQLLTELKSSGAITMHGGDYDSWDLDVRGGLLGSARLRMAVEEHGAGKQFFRFRIWPRYNLAMMLVTLLLAAISLAAIQDGSWLAGTVTGITALVLAARSLIEGALGMAAMVTAAQHLEQP
jgi:glycosyltransferase involved in cell wall biosynthesis